MAPASALEIRPLPAVCRPVAGEALTWDTRNFRIVSEVGIPDRELLKLAVVADATARAVEHHPIAWFDPPRGERPRLFIQRDAASCEAAGAAPGTAGMYLWRRKAVIVDGARLFPVAAAGNRLKPLPDEEILIHEIVHLCMHGSHDRLPQWFAEGVCEYFAAAHQGGGVFRFDSMDRDIRQHLRRRFGKASEAIPAMPVASIADHDADGWLAFMRRQAVEERYSGYVTALLLVHYHLHAGERRIPSRS
jgi:hypothetical protein